MHKSLYTWLTTNGAIQSMFGARIYHEWVPQGVSTWPVLVFRHVSASERAQDMEAPDDTKLDQHVYQFDVFARDSLTAVDAGELFDTVFRKFRGTMGAVRIQSIDRQSFSHAGQVEGDKQMRRIILDYQINFALN